MRHFLVSGLALAAAFVPAAAWGDDAADRNAAIQLCRTAVIEQAGVAAESVRLDTVRTRARFVRVELDLWRDGALQNVRCEVQRGGETLTIAAIDPPVRTTQASAQ